MNRQEIDYSDRYIMKLNFSFIMAMALTTQCFGVEQVESLTPNTRQKIVEHRQAWVDPVNVAPILSKDSENFYQDT